MRFKVGDRVKSSRFYDEKYNGIVGTVTKIDEDQCYVVETFGYTNSIDGSNRVYLVESRAELLIEPWEIWKRIDGV